MTTPKTKRILRLAEVLARVPFSETQLEEKISKGEFPAPIKLSDSGRLNGWLESEIDAYIDARVALRDAKRKQTIAA
jgi:prophage regulatory protein